MATKAREKFFCGKRDWSFTHKRSMSLSQEKVTCACMPRGFVAADTLCLGNKAFDALMAFHERRELGKKIGSPYLPAVATPESPASDGQALGEGATFKNMTVRTTNAR